ncbi:hypothetical protein TVAG_178750 [Trichomonas vaginalis G3]|uniref:DUF3447 domain-containing protein n=1 Tax=Trichomonas vaginalis (strain ATCC PRA-98 / G3) TaxID=412133 RepID=A2DIM7_TRIV3|nr:guanyl-nucleotide exchange factor protein [Trichomonas vaginalis G3]EAY19831.1 hypothetical protein TVAG_178750 [Trichomonas vaginalis G3]KAI5524034.1 guanyl-nucleotide exchange factor protein [Trichomonas vaginalis G3]|eukprot:XP_001580817.1 hypothetical protein [Trichomonas vaginalis G3]
MGASTSVTPDQKINTKNYFELRRIYSYHIDSFKALYQLKTEDAEELNKIYNMVKTNLIDTKIYFPKTIMRDILNIIQYNNRYAKSYLKLVKRISDEYHEKEVRDVPLIVICLFEKEYGFRLDTYNPYRFEVNENIDIHSENTIYRAIMYDDKERFIYFTESDRFDKDQKLKSSLYPNYGGHSLLELCCYHGAVDCFKLLRTKFNSEITQKCLEYSFLGGNPEIMSECLKYQKPNIDCMICAIISHNIDFVTFLMNEYNINIYVDCCIKYKNLESFLVYLDQTDSIKRCFDYSVMFNIPSLCEYFLSLGVDINQKNGSTALHITAQYNFTEVAEFLLLHGANINEEDYSGKTPLRIAAHNNCREVAEILLSYGANINEKDCFGETPLIHAVLYNCKETAELLISRGASINDKTTFGMTALQHARENNCREIEELLLLHGAN